jgi:hypothetical protein
VGDEVGQIGGGAGALAFGHDGKIFALFIADHAARVVEYGSGGAGRTLARYRGYILAPQSGAIAVSPDERRMYVPYDGLHAFNVRTERRLIRLPDVPGNIGLAVAPNGRQAMLWAPNFAQFSDTPSERPGYVINHFGYYPGGVVPVDLGQPPLQLAPPVAAARVAWVDRALAVDPALAVVDPAVAVVDPAVAVAAPPATPGTLPGSWAFTAYATSSGPAGSGNASLTQTGNSISGTLVTGGVSWTVTGSISGSTVYLQFSASGQVDNRDTDTVSADG